MITFSDYISKDFTNLCQYINDNGFKVGVVGGTVRDYFMAVNNKHDYDCELRQIEPCGEFYLKFSELIESLYEFYEIEQLPYGVYRIISNHFECELTLPRAEVFKNEFHHSNFDVRFIQDKNYEEGFKRRDFTLNAMMMEFDGSWTFIDPLNGKDDLAKGNLKPCSDEFFLDPVRFLRAIRFHIKYQLKIDAKILSILKTINIENFSAHYIRTEAIKSTRPLTFLLVLLELSEESLHSQYFDLISQFEGDNTNSDKPLKQMIVEHLYLEKNIFLQLTFMLNLSIKEVLIDGSFYVRDFIALDISHFQAQFDADKVLSVFKKLSSLDGTLIEFLYTNKIIDVDYVDISKINKLNVNLSDVINTERKYYSFLERVKVYFAN